jgi:hypothetical protein
MNSLLGKRGGDEGECEYQPESRIKTAGYCVAVLARDREGVWAWHWTEMHYRSSSEAHGLNVVWSHNNMETITGWPAGMNHTLVPVGLHSIPGILLFDIICCTKIPEFSKACALKNRIGIDAAT